MKVAFVTGASGQDGSYLLELLLKKGYKVHGMVRRTSNLEKIDHLLQSSRSNLVIHYGDMTDILSLINILRIVKDDVVATTPVEVYNLAAQSHVQVSFDSPVNTSLVNSIGVLNLLEAIRSLDMCDMVRVYQASTSEMFGDSPPPQTENSELRPRSPYGVAKLYAHWIVRTYREAYGLWCCSGLLFNHESPRRGDAFVTRKISMAAARLACGESYVLELGNLNAKRDWGHAKDYVKGMWKMLQKEEPIDYVLSTGISITVRELVIIAFEHIGILIRWCGEGIYERGYNIINNELIVRVNPKYYRPCEVDSLRGDSSLAKTDLEWQSEITIKQVIQDMVDADIKKYKCKTSV